MVRKLFLPVCLIAGIFINAGFANPIAVPSGPRININLGATPWKIIMNDPQQTATGPQTAAYNDAAAPDVGIPHSFAEDQTFVNNTSGGGNIPGGPYWYRKKFKLDPSYANKKVFLEFEGAHFGVQVFVNGTLLPGTSAFNPTATHVVGFTGFLYDVTSLVHFDNTDNQIAARVAMNAPYFQDPGFSGVFRFGQGSGGVFRPVWIHLTEKVHVPSNIWSGTHQWGTYAATTNVAADGSSATVRILTNVQNESAASQDVTLLTQIVDNSSGNIVFNRTATQTIAAGQIAQFDQTGTITNPKLWYPNNSMFGKPNLHTVYHIVKVGGTVVDIFKTPFGIRRIIWDKDFPYINGHKHYLWGASGRYDYPALGTGVPAELEWRDAKLLADVGGSLWRPGHSTCSRTFVEACDAYGVMLVQPSGEGEGAFSTGANATAYRRGLKKEIHQEMIIRDRNNPSILSWEASNGDMDSLYADTMRLIGKTWDSLTPRAMALRGVPYTTGQFDLHGCTLTGCDAQQKPLGNHINFPWWGSEYWGRHSSRYAYDFQVNFCAEFLRDWASGIRNNCFGMAQWYLMETPGECGPFVEGIDANSARSFGSSMMDFNRLPKFLYYQYGVCWVPYAKQPRVALANTWNRSATGAVRVDVWSNCPKVRLVVNNTTIGEAVPNPQGGVGGMGDVSNTTTQLPYQCVFPTVTYSPGTIKAIGLDANGNPIAGCVDSQVTAGAPDHIVLTKTDAIVKPNGEKFTITNNGSDVALILATVVDNKGVWCPTASGKITFAVAGPATYRGGADQFVTAGQPYTYHAAKDPELNIEGGKAMVAVRSQFTTGQVTVTATVAGLPQPSASASYSIVQTVDTDIPTVPSGQVGARLGRLATPVVAEIVMKGATLRYNLSTEANVAIELLSVNGKVVKMIPASKQAAGWHPIMIAGKRGDGLSKGAGLYFVRLIVDGKQLAVKKVTVVR
jgi:beta-galactosidase